MPTPPGPDYSRGLDWRAALILGGVAMVIAVAMVWGAVELVEADLMAACEGW